MPEEESQCVSCSVKNCHYWVNGNKCVAKHILVTSGEMARELSPSVDSPYAAEIPETPVNTCTDTCCKTFVSRDDPKAFGDGVKKA